MTRERWFCYVCGAMTARRPDRYGRAFCHAHSGLEVDVIPPDPLESLPVQAADINGEVEQATRERGG